MSLRENGGDFVGYRYTVLGESGFSFSLNYARTGQSHLLVSLDLVVVKHMGRRGGGVTYY